MYPTNIVEKIKTQNLCTIKFFFPRTSCRLCDNVEKCGITRQTTDDNTIRRMPFTGRLIKATVTHSEYVIFIGFTWQQCLTNAPHFYVHRNIYIVSRVTCCVVPTFVHSVNFVYTTVPALMLIPAVGMKFSQN